MVAANELPIDTSASAVDMAEAIFGQGIEVLDATYTGAPGASGIYSKGDQVAPNITPSSTGVILSTGTVTDFTQSSGDPNRSAGTSTDHENPGDADLTAIANTQTYDAAILEVEFVPIGSEITMQVVFSSEEYLEYVNSGFNDAVGVFVNGEKAELTVGDGDITINNINTTSNQNLYLDNPRDSDPFNTEMDGLTVTMTLKATVEPEAKNTIKIAIADGGDGIYDSNLLIAGDSVQSVLVAGDDTVYISGTRPESFDVLANDFSADSLQLTITEINGQTVQPGDSVLLSTGETVMLGMDGTLIFTGDGDNGNNILSYTVEDTVGNSDVGFINLTTTACFVAGTLILTDTCAKPVEDLRIGDRVVTRDNGPQSVRWIGKTDVVAHGLDAPIRFEADALGTHDAVEFSPNHRVLVSSVLAELYFGSFEVLVKAKHLVDGKSIWRRADGSAVTYVHILFDEHQIVYGNGLASESYHPAALSVGSFDAETQAEILRLMPDLNDLNGFGYGPAARRSLRAFESRLLAA